MDETTQSGNMIYLGSAAEPTEGSAYLWPKFLCIVLVDRQSVFSYAAQFSSLQETGTELFILSDRRAEWYVRYLIRY